MKVLLADDERIFRQGVAKSINWNSIGCQLSGVVSNGMEALQSYRLIKPDCVITDIRMPFLNGLELIRIIREQDSVCRFVILSGYDEFEFARTAMKYGVRHYLLKPIEAEELIDVLILLQKEFELSGNDTSVVNKSTGNQDIDILLSYLKTHFYRRDLSLSWISHNLIYKNTDYLGRLFRTITGKSFNAYLTLIRMNRAKEILRRMPDTTVSEIAEATGYPPDGSYFCTQFKQFFGKTVSAFRSELKTGIEI